MIRRGLAAIVALVGLVVLGACSAPEPPERTPVVGVQLFMWNWNSIATECTQNLGPNQFGFVLTSPPQEHITGEAWWIHYQPVSYEIDSNLGTRQEYQQMVQTCHEAGVKVIADAVVNHMTGMDGGVGWAGSEFTHYDYPGIYDEDDFHHCGTLEDEIISYTDAFQVQDCELVNLADLKTETDKVRETLVDYLHDLQELGVDGFRIDAAKHMPAADVEAIVAELPGDPIIISEVIRASSEPIQPEDYLASGSVFAFGLAKEMSAIASGSSMRSYTNIADGTVPTGQAVTFVANHDTERNGQTLNYQVGELYALADALVLASPYGTPMTYSGYAFTELETGPATDDSGLVVDATCAPDSGPNTTYADQQWVCQHRWTQVAGMADWRSVVGDAEVANLVSDQQSVSFDRGELGLFAASNSDQVVQLSLTTDLPDGNYCDALTAPTLASGEERCPEGPWRVRDGKVEGELQPFSAIALHTGLLES